jgi:hypothetical protein
MKKLIIVLSAFAVLFVASSAKAATLYCHSSNQVKCYVKRVSFSSGNGGVYVVGQLSTTGATNPCNFVRVKVGDTGADINEVKAAESVLLTALTTGLPIMFWGPDGEGSGTCDSTELFVGRP